ncbi:hypothetical protein [Rariglobus hedericola]|uniref:Uncharacterized protein n=1 Tax=Rariglobus hedericola TaxID=2597822 RepID=A0A556QMF3_9BACT|nr:hypothetical protein [Rariglobus hedericola]TSJ77803.1 hypothetical protein FPL22_00420 [Rariglobus hedericola]
MSSLPAIICEITAPRSAQAAALAEIAGLCARDAGQRLVVKTLVIGRSKTGVNEPVLTLHLPVELASSQNQIWCLACRLACFCPDARVSVLVQGAFAGAEKAARTRRRRSA